MKRKDKKPTKKPIKRNPLLLEINPPGQVDKLWKQAQKLARNGKIKITRSNFDKALIQYHNQHGCLPNKLSVVNAKGVDVKEKIVVSLGKSDQIYYTPPFHSRKKFRYVHKTKKTSLVTNPSGDSFFYIDPSGSLKMKKDGWMHGG